MTGGIGKAATVHLYGVPMRTCVAYVLMSCLDNDNKYKKQKKQFFLLACREAEIQFYSISLKQRLFLFSCNSIELKFAAPGSYCAAKCCYIRMNFHVQFFVCLFFSI